MEDGGAVCFVAAGGVGGTRGTLSGGMEVSEEGVTGEVDDSEGTAPGGGGCA